MCVTHVVYGRCLCCQNKFVLFSLLTAPYAAISVQFYVVLQCFVVVVVVLILRLTLCNICCVLDISTEYFMCLYVVIFYILPEFFFVYTKMTKIFVLMVCFLLRGIFRSFLF